MPPATATIWHSSTDKSVFVGCGLQHHRLRDSSPAHRYRPPSRPVYPAVACEPTLAPLCCGPGAPARALIWATTHRGESLHGSPGIQWRIPEHIGGKKPKHLDSLEKVRGTVWLYPRCTVPRTAQLSAKRDLLACDFYYRGEWENVSEHQLPQQFGTLPKKPSSVLPHPENWVMSCLTRGWEETRRRPASYWSVRVYICPELIPWELHVLESSLPVYTDFSLFKKHVFWWAEVYIFHVVRSINLPFIVCA